jgi:gamma-glutamyl-gamma-aminobutyrate hydrolase PuuD
MSKPKTKRPKVYIVGGGYEYIKLMYSLGNDGARDLSEADIVLFTGGEDVDPQFYGEIALAKTMFNTNRDKKEIAIFEEAKKRGIPMVGICRGGQFLNVMNGGKLWQHVTNHAVGGSGHLAFVQIAPFNGKGKDKKPRVIRVTSTHHQMMIPHEEGMVLLTALEAIEKNAPGYCKHGGKDKNDPDIEAVFYDATNCLCFQPHPEFGAATAECVDLFEEFMSKFIYPRVKDNKADGVMEAAIVAQSITVPKAKEK